MNQVFSNAAIERIARVVQVPDEEPTNAAGLVRRALEENLVERLDEVVSNTILGSWYGDDLHPALAFVSFTGLLELGSQSGHVFLEEWECIPALKEALSAFVASEGARDGAVDTRLLGALFRRIEQPGSGSRSPDGAAFGSFEAYLHLTSRLRADAAALAFLDETHRYASDRTGEVARDRGPLLSARHFAEAFATGAIAGAPVTDVAAGVALLRYFEWLSDILETLDPESELRAGIVRHARWSHGVSRVGGRFGSWAEQMREWIGRPAEAQAQWTVTAERLFGRLAAEQVRWDASSGAHYIEPQRPENETVTEDEEMNVEQHIQQLVAEGRLEAARELALSEVAASSLWRVPSSNRLWFPHAASFVEQCKRLMELGNVDAAAALVAPLLPELLAQYLPSETKVVTDALAIVARARTAGLRAERETHAQETGQAKASAAREADERSYAHPPLIEPDVI